jgi:hypothetical protein
MGGGGWGGGGGVVGRRVRGQTQGCDLQCQQEQWVGS